MNLSVRESKGIFWMENFCKDIIKAVEGRNSEKWLSESK
jgi:hypothetical protein